MLCQRNKIPNTFIPKWFSCISNHFSFTDQKYKKFQTLWLQNESIAFRIISYLPTQTVNVIQTFSYKVNHFLFTNQNSKKMLCRRKQNSSYFNSKVNSSHIEWILIYRPKLKMLCQRYKIPNISTSKCIACICNDFLFTDQNLKMLCQHNKTSNISTQIELLAFRIISYLKA
jgi:hypothetical protein